MTLVNGYKVDKTMHSTHACLITGLDDLGHIVTDAVRVNQIKLPEISDVFIMYPTAKGIVYHLVLTQIKLAQLTICPLDK